MSIKSTKNPTYVFITNSKISVYNTCINKPLNFNLQMI